MIVFAHSGLVLPGTPATAVHCGLWSPFRQLEWNSIFGTHLKWLAWKVEAGMVSGATVFSQLVSCLCTSPLVAISP